MKPVMILAALGAVAAIATAGEAEAQQRQRANANALDSQWSPQSYTLGGAVMPTIRPAYGSPAPAQSAAQPGGPSGGSSGGDASSGGQQSPPAVSAGSGDQSAEPVNVSAPTPAANPPATGRWAFVGGLGSTMCSMGPYDAWYDCDFRFVCTGGTCATPDPSGWHTAKSCASWGNPDIQPPCWEVSVK